MSVPLPSPSPLPTSFASALSPSKIAAKTSSPISPPTGGAYSTTTPDRERERGRKETLNASGSRRWGAAGTSQSPARDHQSMAHALGNGDGNWRDRNGTPAGTGVAGATPPSAGAIGSGHKSRGGPERTVGGFEKRGERGAGAGVAAVSKDSKEVAAKGESGDKSEKAAALSHVPCRFFKAGACTAGSSCPFSHEEGGKKEVCQWFLKGNCKFGHKCALAHIRPGEPLSMDRKNKKEQQRQTREHQMGDFNKLDPSAPNMPIREISRPSEDQASPVPIRSALSSSIQSPPARDSRYPGSQPIGASSPLREPYGPPSSAAVGSPSAGFLGRSPGGFAASPSRPSPLSAGHAMRNSVPGPISLKSPPTTSIHSPLRPPMSGAPGVFSSSFSHSAFQAEKSGAPLSASFADSPMRRSIWARSETPDEPLSPRRPIPSHVQRQADVFDDDDDHGEDLLPSSLNELLTPMERARRSSRRDSNDSFGASPGRPMPPFSAHLAATSGERLAQSAGATLGPGNFLQSLWAQDGPSASGTAANGTNHDFTFGPATAAPPPRQSLLSQQRAPISPHRLRAGLGGTSASPHRPPPQEWKPEEDEPVPYFARALDPSSPSAKALQEHAPGQSLPGGVATALSRLHLQAAPSALGGGSGSGTSDDGNTPPFPPKADGRKEEHEEGMFAMDG